MDREAEQRLSRISTVWSMVARARGGPEDAEAEAQKALLERYHQAVHRHLVRGTGGAAAADELFQEFTLRFLRGDFRRADEGRGRFRDYVRAALNNLIREHKGKQARLQKQAAAGQAEQVAAPEE